MGLERYGYAPALLWLGSGGLALHLLVWAGLFASVPGRTLTKAEAVILTWAHDRSFQPTRPSYWVMKKTANGAILRGQRKSSRYKPGESIGAEIQFPRNNGTASFREAA